MMDNICAAHATYSDHAMQCNRVKSLLSSGTTEQTRELSWSEHRTPFYRTWVMEFPRESRHSQLISIVSSGKIIDASIKDIWLLRTSTSKRIVGQGLISPRLRIAPTGRLQLVIQAHHGFRVNLNSTFTKPQYICAVDRDVSNSTQFMCTVLVEIPCDSCSTPVPQWVDFAPERREDFLRQGRWICILGHMTEKCHCR